MTARRQQSAVGSSNNTALKIRYIRRYIVEKYFVYRFLNESDKVVYVGKTRQHLEKRIIFHFGSSGHLRPEQIKEIARIEYLTFNSRVEMDIVELYYINKWKPIFNTQAKYDEEFLMEERIGDYWEVLEITEKEDSDKESSPKLRVEIVLTETESDLIDFLERSDVPRATQIKISLRAHMQQLREEKFDERVRRLLQDAIVEVTKDDSIDYKQAWLREKTEKERLAEELESLRNSLRELIPSEQN